MMTGIIILNYQIRYSRSSLESEISTIFFDIIRPPNFNLIV